MNLIFSTSVLEHVECPIQELRELRRKLKVGGRIAIGIKNEGPELWTGWKWYNRDNHLWPWNSMLLGNLLRSAGFYVDAMNVGPFPAMADMEAAIVDSRFGRDKHVFQYIWCYGHRPLPSDTWPQNGTRGQSTVPLTTTQPELNSPRKKKKSRGFWFG